ncbi:hypothetical protein PR048_005497 [Dryococelus australis]|uniref:Uncharacterized protein n=1 Tax=Dryococelus australis TaxID=614101 RepID=A0ABQ9I8E0_9NEOP|nr:hypothetical protein PR048_005497 [Dryococelus australis]
MGGCVLEGMWNTKYAKNTVVHMLSGRQYYRAMRAHIMTQQALLIYFLNMLLNVDMYRQLSNSLIQSLKSSQFQVALLSYGSID